MVITSKNSSNSSFVLIWHFRLHLPVELLWEYLKRYVFET